MDSVAAEPGQGLLGPEVGNEVLSLQLTPATVTGKVKEEGEEGSGPSLTLWQQWYWL